MARKNQNDEQTTLRLPSELMQWIRELSEAEERSVNAQLVVLLKEARTQREQARQTTDRSKLA